MSYRSFSLGGLGYACRQNLGDRLIEDGDAAIDLFGAHRERRGDAPNRRRADGHDIHGKAELHAAFGDGLAGGGIRLARLAVLHQLNAAQQADPTHIADELVLVLQGTQAGAKSLAHLDRTRLEIPLLDHIENRETHVRGQRIGDMRGRMQKALRVAVTLDRFGGYHGGKRHTAAKRLRQSEDVRLDAEMLEGKIAPQAERGLRLVKNEQHVARLAMLPDSVPVTVRR